MKYPRGQAALQDYLVILYPLDSRVVLKSAGVVPLTSHDKQLYLSPVQVKQGALQMSHVSNRFSSSSDSTWSLSEDSAAFAASSSADRAS